jgi:hypothetical protein
MSQQFPVSLSRIFPFHQEDLLALSDTLQDLPYTAERGYGFRYVELSEQILQATLIRRTTTTVKQFDAEARQVVARDIFIFHEIAFAIDAQFRLLTVFGPVSHAPKVRAVLRSLLQTGTKVNRADLAPAEVLSRLFEVAEAVSVQGLTVENFQHQEGVRGRYKIEVLPSAVAQQIVAQYPRNVLRAQVQVALPDLDEFGLQVSGGGRVKVACVESQFGPVLSALKALLFTPTEDIAAP